MHHYNFPSYSVGETKPSRGPGRREIGHGALAERALEPVIPPVEEFPYALRLVSEVLSSNGSHYLRVLSAAPHWLLWTQACPSRLPLQVSPADLSPVTTEASRLW